MQSIGSTLGDRLRKLNPMLRGWGYFYRHAWGAKRIFGALDSYVWWTIFRWLRKKHSRPPVRALVARYGWRKPGQRCLSWRDGSDVPFAMARVTVEQFKLGWLTLPHFARTHGEPGA